MRALRVLLIVAVTVAVLLAAALWGVERRVAGLLRPRAETIVSGR